MENNTGKYLSIMSIRKTSTAILGNNHARPLKNALIILIQLKTTNLVNFLGKNGK